MARRLQWGTRVTVTFSSGARQRVKLPFAPAHPLPQLPLDALRCVLAPEAWRALYSSQLTHPGDEACAVCAKCVGHGGVRTKTRAALRFESGESKIQGFASFSR